MNKKNLSVVLAGAMLATSVAPVLADTTTAKEYSIDDIKLLENEIVSTMKTKMLTTNTLLNEKSSNDFLEATVIAKLGNNKSAYGVRILDTKGNKVDETFKTDEVGTKLANAKAGYTVELVEMETTEFFGEVIPGTLISKGVEDGNYVPAEDFVSGLATTKNEIAPSGSAFVTASNVATASNNEILKVKTNKLEDGGDNTSNLVISLTKDNKKIDGRLPISADNKLLDYTKAEDIEKFDHFETLSTWTKSTAFASDAKTNETYKIVAAPANENTFKAEDLYDGVVLTAKGTEIAADLKNAAEAVGSTVAEVSASIGKAGKGADEDKALVKLSEETFSADAAVYKFTVSYYKNATDAANNNGTGKDAYKTVSVYSSNKKEIESLYNMLSNVDSYQVGIIGGANRYSTAVNVAKAQGAKIDSNNKNIVLVNGNSLVDGLSAAPLAAAVNGDTPVTNVAAPVLLTKADSLTKETKEYITDVLTKDYTKAQRKDVTINLVGGKSVLSENLVSELEDMGFTVKRFGGSDREATSLKVAEKLGKTTAFVVGGNGEADAMAISAVAADKKAPIIVSSVHGLSNKALTYVNENLAKSDITIVGGESVVSKSEEEALNGVLSLNKVSRIAGENRFETNAKIIEKYYEKFSGNVGAEAVLVAKDGQSNKGELVDALAAANYAAQKDAPIVLASNSLSAAQKNALLKMDITSTGTTKSMTLAAQIGNGVERSVLEAVAGLFGLSNK